MLVGAEVDEYHIGETAELLDKGVSLKRPVILLARDDDDLDVAEGSQRRQISGSEQGREADIDHLLAVVRAPHRENDMEDRAPGGADALLTRGRRMDRR